MSPTVPIGARRITHQSTFWMIARREALKERNGSAFPPTFSAATPTAIAITRICSTLKPRYDDAEAIADPMVDRATVRPFGSSPSLFPMASASQPRPTPRMRPRRIWTENDGSRLRRVVESGCDDDMEKPLQGEITGWVHGHGLSGAWERASSRRDVREEPGSSGRPNWAWLTGVARCARIVCGCRSYRTEEG